MRPHHHAIWKHALNKAVGGWLEGHALVSPGETIPSAPLAPAGRPASEASRPPSSRPAQTGIQVHAASER